MADYVVVDKEQLEADITTVSDSIRGLLETEEKLEFPQGMKEAVESYSLDEPLEAQDALIEQIKTALQGKASGGERDIFRFITNGNKLFSGVDFSDNYEAVLEFAPKNGEIDLNNCFYSTNIKSAKLITSSDDTLNANGLFFGCAKLETVDFTECNGKFRVGNLTDVFRNCTVLNEIKGELDFSLPTGISRVFQYCYLLEEVRIKPNSIFVNFEMKNSNLLSAESIQSVIDGLSDLTGETSQTLTLHADVKSKLTETQIATVTSKNWTLA